MAQKLKQHEKVGEEFLSADTTPPDATHRFPFPADMVWAALLDAKAWTEWLPLTGVTWTSPEPFGVGTTRIVEAGKAAIEESFYAWEEGRRMAFRFERSPLPIKAGAEDYRVVETPEGCELQWWGKAKAIFPLGWLVTRQLRAGLKKGMPDLEALIAKDPERFKRG
ncbi:SRPBCC family protein [Parvibaculum sp.]|uniref:SRPBCC family protein n=1 Tax=Parvibaculum sp. TaxID=2024848 RepID=UPI000C90BAB6|nr:SRPBCC family protein [Parvibaculum sp.]MAB15242.1 MxaD family protein [Parvibaculum sp.]